MGASELLPLGLNILLFGSKSATAGSDAEEMDTPTFCLVASDYGSSPGSQRPGFQAPRGRSRGGAAPLSQLSELTGTSAELLLGASYALQAVHSRR